MRHSLYVLVWLTACAAPGDGAGYVQGARAAHQVADDALRRGDQNAAEAALESILQEHVPAAVAKDDARVVRQDAAYRLAELTLETDPRAALRFAERGLDEGRAEDVFTANLLIARGRAREALGDPVAATEDYFDALTINDTLLEQALAGDDQEAP